MSMTLKLESPEGEREYHLACGTGWTEFGNWVKTLSGFRHLKKFIKEGTVEDTFLLANELKEAFDSDPPKDEHVIGVTDQTFGCWKFRRNCFSY